MKRLLCILLVLCSAASNADLLAQDNASYSVRRQRQTSATRQSARKNTDDDQKKTATPARRQTATRQTTNGNKPATTPATTRRTTTSRGAFSLSEAQKTARQTATSPATQSDGNGATAVGPKARQKKEAAQKPENESGLQLTVRAQTQYNAQREVPSAPVWKREVYRTLDLTKPENAGLADPLTPTDGRMNLFTLIFKLLSDKKIQAYTYNLDGNEQLDDAHRADFKDILDRYHVYYRRKRLAATGDTVFVVENSDIPSSEVLSYFIKEVHYYDQHNSSFHTDIEALCPVLHRTGDFDLNIVKYPMFWIRVSDLTPYMNLIQIPTSEYNNAATVELDDYFALQMYEGEIYKTTNPSGRTLAQYCETDSALRKEQKLIEQQLEGVEDALWNNQAPAPADADTAAVADGKKGKDDDKKEEKKSQSRRKSQVKEKKSSSRSSAGSSAPKATVRRQRR